MAQRDRRLLRYARQMRGDPTPAERVMWWELRRRRLGCRFRRQEPIGRFICDFVCATHKLIVECDGESHHDRDRDRRRDAVLRSLGYTVLRFWDSEVYEQRDGVIELIADHCQGPPP